METRTTYFEQRGTGCTAETLRAARERAVQLGARSVRERASGSSR